MKIQLKYNNLITPSFTLYSSGSTIADEAAKKEYVREYGDQTNSWKYFKTIMSLDKKNIIKCTERKNFYKMHKKKKFHYLNN